MKHDGERLLDLAASVSDGDPIDWETVEGEAPDDRERQVIRTLRMLSEVARLHRETESGPIGDPPERWGHLELGERLGAGAFAEVFRARDTVLDRDVALKLLSSRTSAASGGQDALASRAVDEGRRLARIRHSNVVSVLGADEHDGRVGLWMEFVPGRTLDEIVKEAGPFGPREATLIGIDLCRALSAVHGAGTVHLDVKAQNVMREEGGRIVLMDFGVGREIDGGDSKRGPVGTPLYMAPEIAGGGRATETSDIYSLGVLLYFLVSGSYPVVGSTRSEVAEAVRRGERRSLRDARPDLPSDLVAVIERAIEPEPSRRFRSAGEMERVLSEVLGGSRSEPSAAERVKPGRIRHFLSVAAAAVVIVALLIVWREVGPKWSPPPPLYDIQAHLLRETTIGAVRLTDGSRVRPGDALLLEVEASRELFVYVFNWDDRGASYVLFPLPVHDLQNPLPGGATNVLPGAVDGEGKTWSVTSVGGREHFLVIADPDPIPEFEALADEIPAAREGEPIRAAPLDEADQRLLRGIGGLAPRVATPSSSEGAHRLQDIARKLTGDPEQVRGRWVRVITLENP